MDTTVKKTNLSKDLLHLEGDNKSMFQITSPNKDGIEEHVDETPAIVSTDADDLKRKKPEKLVTKRMESKVLNRLKSFMDTIKDEPDLKGRDAKIVSADDESDADTSCDDESDTSCDDNESEVDADMTGDSNSSNESDEEEDEESSDDEDEEGMVEMDIMLMEQNEQFEAIKKLISPSKADLAIGDMNIDDSDDEEDEESDSEEDPDESDE